MAVTISSGTSCPLSLSSCTCEAGVGIIVVRAAAQRSVHSSRRGGQLWDAP